MFQDSHNRVQSHGSLADKAEITKKFSRFEKVHALSEGRP